MAATRACSLASAAENPVLHVEELLTITDRKADQFMRISNTEYSRYENFDLTRIYVQQDSVFVIQIYQTAMVDYI